MILKKQKQFIYIAKMKNEKTRVKIGLTDNPERRLKEYNSTTGVSIDNVYEYLYLFEVKDMKNVENDIKKEFFQVIEQKNREIYMWNDYSKKEIPEFIRKHKLFLKEIECDKKEEIKEIVKIVKKTKPTLKQRETTRKEILQKAQKINNDEFYTRYEDIEKEVKMYDKKIWENKTVFCNCDDPVGENEYRTSAFALFFLKNFKELKLKKLICTHYVPPQREFSFTDLFDAGAEAYIFTKKGFSEIDWENDFDYPKGYDGSFDHKISIKILNEETDIVCTNPPFSRAIDYWKILIESGKKFVIISNIANPITKAFIAYFKDKKAWAGYNRIDYFLNQKKELVEASGHWYTNIKIKKRPKHKHLKIISLKEIPEKYKTYDDNKILMVDNCYIPNDYQKPFAVSARPILNGLLEKGYKIIENNYSYIGFINGKQCFRRVLVQKIKKKE
jgi:predicted GIY-YIG superfamily endonuclease